MLQDLMQVIQDHDGDPAGLLDGLVALAARDTTDQLQRALKVALVTAAIPGPAMEEMVVEVERRREAQDAEDDGEVRALRATLADLRARHTQFVAEQGHVVQLDQDAAALAAEVATEAEELAAREEEEAEWRARAERRRALLEEVRP